jgi:hypothetical protein
MNKFKAFLYSTHNNEFRVQKGYIYVLSNMYFRYYNNIFSTEDIEPEYLNTILDCQDPMYPNLEYFKLFPVSDEPGTLYNCIIWFEEREDQKAFDIFMENELKKINHHENKIKIHLDVIKVLENGIKED